MRFLLLLKSSSLRRLCLKVQAPLPILRVNALPYCTVHTTQLVLVGRILRRLNCIQAETNSIASFHRSAVWQVFCLVYVQNRRKIRLIEVNAKCRHLKNLSYRDFCCEYKGFCHDEVEIGLEPLIMIFHVRKCIKSIKLKIFCQTPLRWSLKLEVLIHINKNSPLVP
jgi:hypothetical protein